MDRSVHACTLNDEIYIVHTKVTPWLFTIITTLLQKHNHFSTKILQRHEISEGCSAYGKWDAHFYNSYNIYLSHVNLTVLEVSF